MYIFVVGFLRGIGKKFFEEVVCNLDFNDEQFVKKGQNGKE